MLEKLNIISFLELAKCFGFISDIRITTILF